MPSTIDVADYCRDLEIYLCRKNDGHLIRIVGPSFDIVSGWAARGVPLKVAMGGIDRYFERYYRKGPRRRPAKIDFCEADVLDVFDEWRRATGITADVTAVDQTSHAEATEVEAPRRHGPSLPDHLQRVLARLSTLRATGVLVGAADRVLDAVSVELDAARSRGGGVRGDARRALLARLEQLDAELVMLVRASVHPELLASAHEEAVRDLASFRETMTPDAFARAVERASTRALRDRVGLPVVAFT